MVFMQKSSITLLRRSAPVQNARKLANKQAKFTRARSFRRETTKKREPDTCTNSRMTAPGRSGLRVSSLRANANHAEESSLACITTPRCRLQLALTSVVFCVILPGSIFLLHTDNFESICPIATLSCSHGDIIWLILTIEIMP